MNTTYCVENESGEIVCDYQKDCKTVLERARELSRADQDQFFEVVDNLGRVVTTFEGGRQL